MARVRQVFTLLRAAFARAHAHGAFFHFFARLRFYGALFCAMLVMPQPVPRQHMRMFHGAQVNERHARGHVC